MLIPYRYTVPGMSRIHGSLSSPCGSLNRRVKKKIADPLQRRLHSTGDLSFPISSYSPLLQVHPEVREDVRSLIPPPDLVSMEERLNQFKRNIYKVVPLPI